MPKKTTPVKAREDAGWKESVYTSLRELGLNRGEIGLYTASIDLGPTSISALARHLKISRPSAYKHIARLASIGLANLPEHEGGRARFIVESPTTVLAKIREKRNVCSDLDRSLSAAMPGIFAVYNRTARPANIRVFHGLAQLTHLHDSVLDEPDANIRFFGSALTFAKFLTEKELDSWVKRKVKAGIWNRVLIPSTENRLLTPDAESYLREIRIFNDAPAFSTVFQLFAGKVIFWWPETMTALLIEDAALFTMMEAIFTTYWKSAIPVREFFGKDGYPLKEEDESQIVTN